MPAVSEVARPESRKTGFVIKPPEEADTPTKKKTRLLGRLSRTITVTGGAISIDP